MLRQFLAISFSAVAFMSTQTALAAEEIVWKEQKITLQAEPKKIAVYDLSALDILNKLGVKADLVPKTNYPHDLNGYNQESVTKAGTLFEPDVALLKTQNPELIIVGRRSAKAGAELGDIAPVLDITENLSGDYMADLKARTEVLANIFGKQELAKKEFKRLEEKQAKLKAQTQGKTALILFSNNGNFAPLAEGDRFGFVYGISGLTSVVPKREPLPAGATPPQRPEPGTPEAIAAKEKADARLLAAVEQQPDYIFILDRGALNTHNYTAKDEAAKNPILSKATGKVVVGDIDLWYLISTGLSTTGYLFDELLEATK